MITNIVNNSRDIILRIVLFFVIIFFLIFFYYLFGMANAIIGVTSITIILMLFDKDMTDHPIKNTLSLMGINILMLAASIAFTFNFTVFLLINFMLVFLISYHYSNDFDKPIYLPFLLQYIFILMTPVAGAVEMLPRVIALFIGPLIIMILQLTISILYPTPKINLSIIGLSDLVHDKIKLLLAGKPVRRINLLINDMLVDLRGQFYEARIEHHLSSKDCIHYLNLATAFDKLNKNLDTHQVSKAMLNDLLEFCSLTEEFLSGDIKVNTLTKFINGFTKEYQTKVVYRERVEIFNSLNLIKDALSEIVKVNESKTTSLVPTIIKKLKLDAYLNFTTLSFSFALKTAVAISTLLLISNIFGFVAGFFMVIGFIMYNRPIYRFEATDVLYIAPALLFLAFLSLTTIALHAWLFILMLIIYALVQTKNNNIRNLAMIALAVGVGLVINSDVNLLLILAYVLIGVITGILFNLYFLPFKLTNKRNELRTMFYEIIHDMMHEVNVYLGSKTRPKKELYYMNSLYINTSLILEQIRTLSEEAGIRDDNVNSVRRHLAADVYELYIITDKISNPDLIRKPFNKIMSISDHSKMHLETISPGKEYPVNDKLAIILLNNIIKQVQFTKLRR